MLYIVKPRRATKDDDNGTSNKDITKCARAGITSNENRFCFRRKELDYLGFHLNKNSVEPSADMLRSIAKFPEPKDITGVRINQVDGSHNDWSIMEPLRPLNQG